MPVSYRAAQNLIKRGDEAALRAALASGLDANARNENGWTLLMLAAVEGRAELGRLLLQSGADTTVRNSKGETAASIAAGREHAAFVALLTEGNATP